MIQKRRTVCEIGHARTARSPILQDYAGRFWSSPGWSTRVKKCTSSALIGSFLKRRPQYSPEAFLTQNHVNRQKIADVPAHFWKIIYRCFLVAPWGEKSTPSLEVLNLIQAKRKGLLKNRLRRFLGPNLGFGQIWSKIGHFSDFFENRNFFHFFGSKNWNDLKVFDGKLKKNGYFPDSTDFSIRKDALSANLEIRIYIFGRSIFRNSNNKGPERNRDHFGRFSRVMGVLLNSELILGLEPEKSNFRDLPGSSFLLGFGI